VLAVLAVNMYIQQHSSTVGRCRRRARLYVWTGPRERVRAAEQSGLGAAGSVAVHWEEGNNCVSPLAPHVEKIRDGARRAAPHLFAAMMVVALAPSSAVPSTNSTARQRQAEAGRGRQKQDPQTLRDRAFYVHITILAGPGCWPAPRPASRSQGH
jgi:hypothetical protein